MNKFKVGDRVRFIAGAGSALMDGVYTVSKTQKYGEIELEGVWWYEERFELVADAPVPHKHAALIKLWADGAKIQWRPTKYANSGWVDITDPAWLNDCCEYRVKPEPKPDVVYEHFVYDNGRRAVSGNGPTNVKFTFDGDTGKLKAVELLG